MKLINHSNLVKLCKFILNRKPPIYADQPPSSARITFSNDICNFTPPCKICGIDITGAKKGKMSLEQFKDIVTEVDFVEQVVISAAGEPFLFEDFFDIINFCKQRGKSTSTTTNGSLLDDIVCRKIIDSGLDVISISLDGATRETYEKIRPGGDFNTIVDNIERLVEAKRRYKGHIKIVITVVMMKENFDELLEFVDLAAKFKVNLSFYNLCFYTAEWATFEHSLMAMDRKKVKRRLLELSRKMQEKGVKGYIQTPVLNSQWKKCRQAWDWVAVDWEGRLKPCGEDEVSFAKIEKGNFFKIWNGKDFLEWRKKLLYGPLPKACVGCVNL